MTDDRKPVTFQTQSDMPDKVMSLKSMLWNCTGSWRYLRPAYKDNVPACNEGCPAGNDIETFIRRIEEKKFDEAWRVLKEENPLARVTGRVCFHPCEAACNRKDYDRSTSIQALERFAADHGSRDLLPGPVRKSSGKKVAVVGSGPAGLTTAWHLARMGHAVTVFDDQEKPGGVLRIGIPEYRLPDSVLDEEIEDIRALGVEFRMNTKIGGELDLDELRQQFDAVFLGTGVHVSRKLDIPGEDSQGVMPGLAMLKAINMGKTPGIGKRVVVIVGGNTAIDSCRAALRLGAAVHLLYRRGRAEMPAHDEEVDEAVLEGVKMKMLCAPVEALAEGGKVTGLKCVEMKLGDPDESGRRRPVKIEGSEFVVETDTIITAIGEQADFDYVPGEIDRQGDDLITDEWGQTTLPGVFAGGDAAGVKHTVTDAIGAGKKAAISIDRFLGGESVEQPFPVIGEKGGVSIGRYLKGNLTHPSIGSEKVVRFTDLNPAYFTEISRSKMPRLTLEERKENFSEINLGLTEQQALEAAGRCFHCGVCTMCDNCYLLCPDISIHPKADGSFGYDINLDYCKGCGICVQECPRCAMKMEADQ